jgi:hypothetical protein
MLSIDMSQQIKAKTSKLFMYQALILSFMSLFIIAIVQG